MDSDLFKQIIQTCMQPDGWKTNLLLVPGKKPIYFGRTVAVLIRQTDVGHECEVTDSGLQLPVNNRLAFKLADLVQEAERPLVMLIAVVASTPELALAQAHEQILATARRLIQTPS
ncbi:MAG: hypothetical protein WCW31_04130, partial [Patescibacteria group bacterium]